MIESAAISPLPNENDSRSDAESPFEIATITEGYPFDKAEQQVIKHLLQETRERQARLAPVAPVPAQ